MKMKKEDIERRIQEIEAAQLQPDFWQNSDKAQALIKEMQDLQSELLGGTRYDTGDAIMTIFSGAG